LGLFFLFATGFAVAPQYFKHDFDFIGSSALIAHIFKMINIITILIEITFIA